MADIMDKLRKLLKQQAGEEALGNKAAAQAFAAKVQELLLKHKLELSDLELDEEERVNPLVCRVIHPSQWGEKRIGNRIIWTESMASVIAEGCLCRALAEVDSNCVLIAGRKTDVDIAEALFCRIMRAALNICEAELAEKVLAMQGERASASYSRIIWEMNGGNASFRYSFMTGFIHALMVRFKNNRKHIEQASSNTTALVRTEKAVDDFIKEDIKPEEGRENIEGEANVQWDVYRKGARHGAEIELQK